MTEIINEYASALFELAHEQGKEKEFSEAIHKVSDILQAEPDYSEILSSPNVPLSQRKALITGAFADAVPGYVLYFLQLLCEKRRIKDFTECVADYDALYMVFCKKSTAHVLSAVELTQDEKDALEKKLCAVSGHTVVAEYDTDSSLIGGLVINIDDKVIDGSLRHKLKEIKEVIDR